MKRISTVLIVFAQSHARSFLTVSSNNIYINESGLLLKSVACLYFPLLAKRYDAISELAELLLMT